MTHDTAPLVQPTSDEQREAAVEAMTAIRRAIEIVRDPAMALGFGIQIQMELLRPVDRSLRHSAGRHLARIAANKLNAEDGATS